MELIKTINFLNLDNGSLIRFCYSYDFFSERALFTVYEIKKYFKDSNIFIKNVDIHIEDENDVLFNFLVSEEDMNCIKDIDELRYKERNTKTE